MDGTWVRRLCAVMIAIECFFLLIMAWAALRVLDIYGLRGGEVNGLERMAWSSPFWGSAFLFLLAAYLVVIQAESDSLKRVTVRWALLAVVGLENMIMLVATLMQARDQDSVAFNLVMASLCGVVLLLIVASQASAVSALGRGSVQRSMN